MTQRLLDACPDVTWRLFVALGRYGGFRVPSEACSLRGRTFSGIKTRSWCKAPRVSDTARASG